MKRCDHSQKYWPVALPGEARGWVCRACGVSESDGDMLAKVVYSFVIIAMGVFWLTWVFLSRGES